MIKLHEKTDTGSKDDIETKNIVIVGGGTAGWMTAHLMLEHWSKSDNKVSITLIESPEIGVIGVGEGSTPQLKTFFDKIRVSEEEWMPQCNASYKNGILFKNWSTRKGFEHYFHPFTSLIDAHTAPAFVYNTQFRRKGHDVECKPDTFFLAAHLAEKQRTPIGNNNFPFDISYGYHFDAVLLGKFLREVGIKKGVNHISAKVIATELTDSGDIKQLILADDTKVEGDFFIDCSGFASILLQKALKVPFISFKENLFNDSAVTIATPRNPSENLNSQTIATAMKYGWAWDIPLTNRTGNGYVYSSEFCTKEQAEEELRNKLNLKDGAIKANHLTMKVGRVKKHWYRNCLAVGLSQGFIEPLEATALHFVQETIETFIDLYSKGDLKNDLQTEFNEKINARFDGIRDYIVAHYRLTDREDTEYWRRNGGNPNISNNLKKIVQAWMKGEDLNQTLVNSDVVSFYPPISWHAILAGYGVFPKVDNQLFKNADANKYDLAHIEQFIERCGLNFQDHLAHLTSRKHS
ncbi:MAG: tryptophan 7-halogenase [Thalassotalea sp.]|nr:tryptophan 7-halogenase [Thalassotalea sp.]